MFSTRSNSISPFLTFALAGMPARSRPRRVASTMRFWVSGAERTSPPSPTSPMYTVADGSVWLVKARLIAAQIARSAAGSLSLIPPITLM